MREMGNRMGAGLARASWQQLSRQSGAASEAQFFAKVQRINPVRSPEIEADAIVPALQCAIIGVGTFAVVTPLALIMFGEAGWLVGVVASGIGVGAAALDAIYAARRSLYATEELEDNLFAMQNSSAEASVSSSEVTLVVRREDVGVYPQILKRSLPVDEERLREFALVAVQGQPITQKEWVGRDKLFSRTEFDAVMQNLLELGLVAWASSRDAAQGRILTRGGRAALQAWIDGRVEWGKPGAHASTHASSGGVLEAEAEGLE